MMNKSERKLKKQTIAMTIWCNILRQQYLMGITNEQLCETLGITARTLYNYQKDPSVLTLRQLQSFLDALNIEMQSLLVA